MVVKPQLIVAEDCLLLSSDSRCSGQTLDNRRLQKGFPRRVWGVWEEMDWFGGWVGRTGMVANVKGGMAGFTES